mgnify:CR=1 FL=1
MKITKYGLIGYPLSHSFSPRYFTEKFDRLNLIGYSYKAYSIDEVSKVLDVLDEGVAGLRG